LPDREEPGSARVGFREPSCHPQQGRPAHTAAASAHPRLQHEDQAQPRRPAHPESPGSRGLPVSQPEGQLLQRRLPAAALVNLCLLIS